MGRLRDSRSAVTACTLVSIAAGLALELGLHAPGTVVDAGRVHLVPTSDGWVSAPPPRPPASSKPPRQPQQPGPPETSTSPPTSSGPPGPGTSTGTEKGSSAGQGGGGDSRGPGHGGGTTRTPGTHGTGPSGPARCSSPRPVHGYEASFVFPCEGSVTNTFPTLTLHVPAYPPANLGGLTVVQTVLTDKFGPVAGPLMFSFVDGITPETNKDGPEGTWTQDVRVGTSCTHDRGKTRISIYFLTPDGVKEEHTWKGGVPLRRIPPGSQLMDEVTVRRVGSPTPCEQSPSPTGSPTTSPTPTQPSPTTPPPTTPPPTTPAPTTPTPTRPSPTTPAATAPPAGP